MKPENMRIAAAVLQGWTLEKTNVHDGTCWHLNGIQSEIAPPDYHTDLRAMEELVSNLKPAEANEWADELTRVTSFGANPHFSHWFHLANASAVQRLEAYLKIKQLWID